MLNQFLNILLKLVSQLLDILPKSPFKSFIDSIRGNIPYVGYINWLLPVKSMMVVGGAWVGAIAIYYIYSAILRWVKAID